MRVHGAVRTAQGTGRCVEFHGAAAQYARGRVVLTVAHRDHKPEHCGDGNLLACCQRCHLRYDRQHHKVSAGEAAGQMRLIMLDKP